FADAGARARGGVHTRVRHRRRVRDEAFHATERFSEREAMQAIDKRFDRGLTAGEIETEHRAEAVLLLARERVARMRAQAGKVHISHSVVSEEQFRGRGRVRLMRGEAWPERA